MYKQFNIKIEFQMEPSDRSVGIMSEGFSAWDSNGSVWCDLHILANKFQDCSFIWYDNETGDVLSKKESFIPNADIIEKMLFAWVNVYYQSQYS